jgi:rod shape determining protein RodA
VLRIDRRSIQNFDWVLLGLAATLVILGLVNLLSATHSGVEADTNDIFRRQLLALGVASVAMIGVCAIDYRRFARLAMPLYMASMALVLLPILLSPATRGAQAWLFEGRVQPSEFAKLALILGLARYFQRNPPTEITRVTQLGMPLLIIALPVGIIALQNDIGVALLTLLIGTTFLPFVRIPWQAWTGLGAAGLAGLAAFWSYGLRDYQRTRIFDFLDPARDPLASGYQAMQSRIAVGSGGLLGTGWMEGSQTQLRFLPTQHTDFVFSVLAEEWGFVGSVLVLAVYLVLLLWGLWVARNAKDAFGAMLAVGVVGTLFWPATINVAMVLGLAPVIGVPLPLFSYGGSALLSAGIAIGLLLNVSMRRYVF